MTKTTPPKDPGPQKRTFVLTRAPAAGPEKVAPAGAPKAVVTSTAPKSKWVVQASVSPPAQKRGESPDATANAGTGSGIAKNKAGGLQAAGTGMKATLTPPPGGLASIRTASPQVAAASPTPNTAPLTLPPNLEDLAERLAKPMVREWLNEELPRLIGRVLAGKVGR